MKYRKTALIEAYQTEEEMDIETFEGIMHANAGDWIATGVRGEQYPIADGIFQETYEPADQSAIDELLGAWKVRLGDLQDMLAGEMNPSVIPIFLIERNIIAQCIEELEAVL